MRTAADVTKLKRLIKSKNADIPVIAKIEKPEALDNLEEILAVVDGVMVARGDLAGEISFEHVPTAQKNIIKRANALGKLSIVATEMLSSMTENPLPTRAEVSDVANAVLDGTDMIMLSNETASGKNPLKAVEAMSAIATEAEKMLTQEETLPESCGKRDQQLGLTQAMCLSASFLSHELNAKAIVVLTSSVRPPESYPNIVPAASFMRQRITRSFIGGWRHIIMCSRYCWTVRCRKMKVKRISHMNRSSNVC